MNDAAPKRVPKHSARRAGLKQKRVPPIFFEALKATEARALRAEAQVAELVSQVQALFEMGVLDKYSTTDEDPQAKLWALVREPEAP